jgi:hypothetical protein
MNAARRPTDPQCAAKWWRSSSGWLHHHQMDNQICERPRCTLGRSPPESRSFSHPPVGGEATTTTTKTSTTCAHDVGLVFSWAIAMGVDSRGSDTFDVRDRGKERWWKNCVDGIGEIVDGSSGRGMFFFVFWTGVTSTAWIGELSSVFKYLTANTFSLRSAEN